LRVKLKTLEELHRLVSEFDGKDPSKSALDLLAAAKQYCLRKIKEERER